MSPYATMVPPLYSERKVLHIEPDKLLHQSHLLIILPKTKKSVRICVKRKRRLLHVRFERN